MTEPVVETLNGPVRGLIERSIEGIQYCAFKGIPYAKPPVGELRFKDPVPFGKWSGVRDANKYVEMCAQIDMFSKEQSNNEDCLHLNVYVKSIDSKVRKPVLVWIHGGGFYCGSATDMFYGPDYLIKKDIVLVTINYRVGIFGFLDLDDEVAPGNQGLKDQVMCLQWIHDNIQNFGGDSDNVTIFGESAGGASVHYLTLSPLTKGLFHKAISQSGCAFNPWASSKKRSRNAYEFCSLLGKEVRSPKEAVEFLRTFEPKVLVETCEKMKATHGAIIFGPTIDDKSPNPFLPWPVSEAAAKGVHVPYLTGHTDTESQLFLTGLTKEQTFKMMNENLDMLFSFGAQTVLDRYNLTKEQMKRLYYKSREIALENREIFLNLSSDIQFVEGIHKFVKIQVEKSSAPTYLYQFTYDPGYSLVKSNVKPPIAGASHFDDVGYLFKMRAYEQCGIPHLKKGTQNYKIMEQMTELWTNFAKYGRPTIATSELIPVLWKPVIDGTVFRYLNIDEDLIMKSTLNLEQRYLSAKDIKTCTKK